MELETVINYVTNSTNPDGVRAQEIKEALEEDIQEELHHAQQFAARIKELYGVVPASMDFKAEAIELYTRIVETTEEVDPVTQDMVIDILHDEQGHRRLFEGFLREYEAEGLA